MGPWTRGIGITPETMGLWRETAIRTEPLLVGKEQRAMNQVMSERVRQRRRERVAIRGYAGEIAAMTGAGEVRRNLLRVFGLRVD